MFVEEEEEKHDTLLPIAVSNTIQLHILPTFFPSEIVEFHSIHCCITVSSCVSGDLL
jgi:hypothetical protein